MAPYDPQKKQLIEKVLQLWRIHAETYRTNPLRYQFMLSAKRELGIEPLNKIKKSELDEYPEIPFLRILDEETAKRTLEDSSIGRLSFLAATIIHAVSYDFAYRTLYNRVAEFTYELSHYQLPKTMLGIDPDKRKSRGARARHHINEES